MSKKYMILLVLVILVVCVLSSLLVANADSSRKVNASASGNFPDIPSPPANATPVLADAVQLPTPTPAQKYHHTNLGGRAAIKPTLKDVTDVTKSNFTENDAKQFVRNNIGMFHIAAKSSVTVTSVTFMTIGDFWKWEKANHLGSVQGEELGDELICRVLIDGKFDLNATGAFVLFDAHTGNWFESGYYK